jgi:hypothetical protein
MGRWLDAYMHLGVKMHPRLVKQIVQRSDPEVGGTFAQGPWSQIDRPFLLPTLALLFLQMSALGQKQTFKRQSVMSALPPKADIWPDPRNARQIAPIDLPQGRGAAVKSIS